MTPSVTAVYVTDNTRETITITDDTSVKKVLNTDWLEYTLSTAGDLMIYSDYYAYQFDKPVNHAAIAFAERLQPGFSSLHTLRGPTVFARLVDGDHLANWSD